MSKTPGPAKKWGNVPQCPACKKSVYPLEQVFASDRKPFHKPCIKCSVTDCGNNLTEKEMRKHEGNNICGKCYDLIYRPREYLAEGEETASERRARLAREAEERDRRRMAGEEERMKAEMAEKDEFNFSFLKIAEIVGIAPDSTICL